MALDDRSIESLTLFPISLFQGWLVYKPKDPQNRRTAMRCISLYLRLCSLLIVPIASLHNLWLVKPKAAHGRTFKVAHQRVNQRPAFATCLRLQKQRHRQARGRPPQWAAFALALVSVSLSECFPCWVIATMPIGNVCGGG